MLTQLYMDMISGVKRYNYSDKCLEDESGM
jgi:hypothetical protein